MSIIKLFKGEPKPTTPKPVWVLKHYMRVTLKNGEYCTFNRKYDSTKTLEEPYSDFMDWFRANVGSKSFTLSWTNSETSFGQRTIVKSEIQMIGIYVMEVS